VKAEFAEVKRLTKFNRDMKRLSKRFRTLEEDLERFINFQLRLTHKLGIDNGGVVLIANLGIEEPQIYKARRFACKALAGTGGMSGIRIVYAYYHDSDIIELIEIYYKGDKKNEDRKRILKYYS